MQGIANAHYLVEVDGVAAVMASEVEIGGVKHEPFKINVGNRPNPILGRSTYEVEEVKIKNAYALNNEGESLFRMFETYILGTSVTKINMRVVALDQDGKTPVKTHEFIDCVPTMFQPENRKGDSKDAAYFTISFKPEDYTEL